MYNPMKTPVPSMTHHSRVFHPALLGYFTLSLAALVLVGCGSKKDDAENSGPDKKAPPPVTKKAPEPTVPSFTEPKEVKGIYVTAWSAASKKKMEKLLGLLDRTELNAVVIDVRDDGEMYWETGIDLADKSKANMKAVTKPKELMELLAKHKIWPIARIACFRDSYVPKHFPELAVQTEQGKVWTDHSRHTWLDPYNKKNWEYIAATVDFALKVGFPEIQLDYVRFPSEGRKLAQVFPAMKSWGKDLPDKNDLIPQFSAYIRERVKKAKAVYSADLFGIISSGTADQGIGQTLAKLAESYDVICPMVYPSHFAKGEYNIKDPNRAPFEIITKSLGDYKKKIPKARIRPWLQDFSLGYPYGAKEVQAQIKASRALGYNEFLLWNAGSKFTEAALAVEPTKPTER